ncbi:hypothetical protein ANN_09577 [Periplaneta americana]|uniref:Endonuclease/exonuclease/phosphatase domain-containing protein n=1 Tax=Periplaneta americana TaxID=6978 RepID=A0ABQ8TQB3_PERAM|nr:hypothetical protein ANN_09577 [Periplaneta americana]
MLINRTKLCTVIGVYYKEKIIDIISGGLAKVQQHELVIIAGDMNCRIDVHNRKAETVLQFLEEEGLTLINKAPEKTYVCHSGSSTIDLVLKYMKSVRKVTQEMLKIAARKHMPVATTFTLQKESPTCPWNPKISRKLDTQRTEQSHTRIKEAE